MSAFGNKADIQGCCDDSPLMTLNRHARLAHLLHNGEAETGARNPMASSPSACMLALGDDDQIPEIRMMH